MVGATLMTWMEGGLAELARHEQQLNQLNVFPVPDGDTGHNMVGTVESAVRAMRSNGDSTLAAVWQRIADGALMGARGNSGVILSQILMGFSESSEALSFFEARDLKRAFRRAAERARQQVAHPVEGTILTVADAMAEGCRDDGDLIGCLSSAVDAGEEALLHTQEQLPALAHAGMVDAGALGYVSLVRGWLLAARGEGPAPVAESLPKATHSHHAVADDAEIPYFYDVEALVYRFRMEDPAEFLSEQLPRIGDSVVIAPGRDQLKIHVHTDQPVRLMELLTRVGDIRQMECLDMRQQVAERHIAPGLTVVAPVPLHPLFRDAHRVLTPEVGVDAPHTLWINPPQALEQGLAVPSVGAAGQVTMEYDPGESWSVNRERMEACLRAMRWWIVNRVGTGYQWAGTVYESRQALGAAVQREIPHLGVITVYLSQNARREEAAFWQDAFNAELVQVPHQSPWMEIVWQA